LTDRVILSGVEYEIREFTREDAVNPERFLDFINRLIEDEGAMILMDKPLTREMESRWLAERLSALFTGSELLLVAEREGRLVGVSDLKLRPGRSSHVAEVGISIAGEENRGSGLGAAILQRVIGWGGERLDPRPLYLRLSVFSKNERARSLYRKFGFREVATIPGQFVFNGDLQDEIVMIRDFRQPL